MEELREKGSVPESKDFKIFGKRLEAINKELNVWTPSTWWEFLCYRGWVEDESSYWAFWVGAIGAFVLAGISLVLNGFQLHYAMHPISPTS